MLCNVDIKYSLLSYCIDFCFNELTFNRLQRFLSEDFSDIIL